MTTSTGDPEVQLLARIATRLEVKYIDDNAQWNGSAFAWLKGGLASRRKGVAFEELVSEWCTEKGLEVRPSPDSAADRIIAGVRTEIKGSTLWKGGVYRFQQIRDQNYGILLCLGISPFDAHCWAIPKAVVMRWWGDGIIRSQHGGAGGTDTAWLAVNPSAVPDWLQPYGGTLSAGLAQLRSLSRQI